MEQNTDRMGFALIALSIVAVVLIIMNTIFGPTVKSYFQGLQKWSDNVMNQLNPPQQYTHTAYSWSADGKDRFTTTKPKYNLLNGTKVHDVFNGTGLTNSGGTQRYSLDNNKQFKDLNVTDYRNLVFEYDWKATGSNLSGYFLYQSSPTWYKGTGITISPTNTSGHVKNVFYNMPMTSDTASIITVRQDNIPTTVKVEISNVMMYVLNGDSKAPVIYMPSQSEATQADEPTYIGTYTDTNEQGSQDPLKYTWTKTN